ncbi:hypothetical protein [Vacuolonema iberomarrocanum]|uniref:hypothetical protein n=1 Tax=Vacuolonema iberomarrocanum TaxID=3454632 RepID=UPI0019E5DC64|nr:hypothetical protein [filamentous cyanobacterium LEGE 07170]
MTSEYRWRCAQGSMAPAILAGAIARSNPHRFEMTHCLSNTGLIATVKATPS